MYVEEYDACLAIDLDKLDRTWCCRIPRRLLSSSSLRHLNDFLSIRLGKSFRSLNVVIKLMEMYVILVIRRSIPPLLERWLCCTEISLDLMACRRRKMFVDN